MTKRVKRHYFLMVGYMLLIAYPCHAETKTPASSGSDCAPQLLMSTGGLIRNGQPQCMKLPANRQFKPRPLVDLLSKTMTPEQRKIAEAVVTGDQTNAISLIYKSNGDLNFQVFNDGSPHGLLLWAVERHIPDLARALISKGLDISRGYAPPGKNNIFVNAMVPPSPQFRQERREIVEALLAAKIEATKRARMLDEALVALTRYSAIDDDEILGLLIRAKANIDTPIAVMYPGNDSTKEETALSQAIRWNEPMKADQLLKWGASASANRSIALKAAVEKCDLKRVRQLIRLGADVNVRAVSFLRPEAKPACADINFALLDAGANANGCTESGKGCEPSNQLLVVAIQFGNMPLIRALLKKRADPNGSSTTISLPLATILRRSKGGNYGAFPLDKVETVKLLLDAGANPNRGELLSAYQGDEPMVLEMLLDSGATLSPVRLKNGEVTGPITRAIQMKLGAEVTLGLLRRHKRTLDKSERHALRIAIAEKRNELIVPLLKAGSDPNDRGPRGETSLHLAVQHDDATLIDRLIETGANPDLITNAIGEAPHKMESALKQKYGEEYLAWLLLSTKIALQNTSSRGEIPKEMVGYVEQFKELEAQNNELLSQYKALGYFPRFHDGNSSPLMEAAAAGKANAVSGLLAAGANKSLRSYRGLSAADFAKRSGNTEIEALLSK